jgi:ABC-2 type transport system permease protein
MTTASTTTATATAGGPGLPGMKVTQVRIIRSEWTKFRSLRSTYITLAVSLVLTIGLGALISALIAANWDKASESDRLTFDPVGTSLAGANIAQLAVGVLGVLLLSGEYATGMIRASLTAVPKRLPVLWAKIVVFAAVVGVSSIISTFVAFFLGQALLSSKHIDTSISADGVPRMVAGAGIYLLLIGIIGMALGGLLRNTAAGISSLVALIFVIPPILGLLPSKFADKITPYLLPNAGESFWGSPDNSHHLSPGGGFGVLLIWTVVAVTLAAIRLVRDDA